MAQKRAQRKADGLFWGKRFLNLKFEELSIIELLGDLYGNLLDDSNVGQVEGSTSLGYLIGDENIFGRVYRALSLDDGANEKAASNLYRGISYLALA